MRRRDTPDIAPVVDISPMDRETALRIVCSSAAVMKVRSSTRGGVRVKVVETGERFGADGPTLTLIINEPLFNRGW